MANVVSMRVGIVLFKREPGVHDNPDLRVACEECEHDVPLFVLDDAEARLPLSALRSPARARA